MSDATATRAGFVALIGAPNAGKSTLLNALVGAKVSIVSPKVQTTRFRVLGIALEGAAQIVFVDTPGLFEPRKRLDRAMVAAAWQGAADADLVVLVVDAHRNRPGIDPDTAAILEKLGAAGRQAILALNKVDLVPPPVLLPMTERFLATGRVGDVFMVAAESGDGVADLRRRVGELLPAGPHLFPADQLSDLPDRLLAAEIVREQLFRQLAQELPYAATVETEAWTEREDGAVRIDATIFVERDGQKAIVLGKGGATIKELGSSARTEMEALFGHKVHLFLHVKVRENWADDPAHYREMGLEIPKA